MHNALKVVLVTPETAHVSLGVGAAASAALFVKFTANIGCSFSTRGVLLLAAKNVHIDLTLLSFGRFILVVWSERLFISSLGLICASDL